MDGSVGLSGGLGRYLANRSVLLTIRHVIWSGSFLEAGVKKLFIAFSGTDMVNEDRIRRRIDETYW